MMVRRIIVKIDIDNLKRIELLKLEQDYELASLNDAMQSKDHAEIERCKKRLAEVHIELAELS
ncbi:hypothetical protein ACIQXW_23315 [Lysinibacillus sp. NPDC097162]|uniref:hypothetical protein n=1 Tax=Lysinibacillus sp. NPDC097162 TaxID=3364140 RepID=UPI0038059E00